MSLPDYCVQLTANQFEELKKFNSVKLSKEQKECMDKTFDEMEETNRHYAEWFEENNKRFLKGQKHITLEDFYKQNNYFKKG